MRLRSIVAILLACAASATAKNTQTKVSQVIESVALTEDVDYVITSDEPFGAMGSVDIQNTEHAVLIIQSKRPSEVIKMLKNHVFINGAQAVNSNNCQVKMFNRGAIIFPYASGFKPLTCYTEANYGGKEYNNYTEGHENGFMKSLTATNLNNSIRSFKLKRGYMVTFAVGKGGWGYSRCFIADMEDLEIPVMPEPFNGTISSYRLFKWYNASKAGVHDTSKNANAALRTTSCFDWGQGNESLLPDVEWISHHIYEDWPSASTCGSVTGTCHMKTNNEPGNSADDHPQSVQEVLNNWQNLMRTGLRLCSESSHDGSMNHLSQFINEIDKRGWRCDILDLHCYWDGQWNSLDWYISEYGKGRPCWISEWVWGSSWGHAGAFADGRQSDNATYNGTVPILERLNKTAKVERYFYWNSEQWYTKIWRDDKLTKLGEYYAKMDAPLAYNAKNEYVPKVVYQAPQALKGTYNATAGTIKLTWNDDNGDMLDSIAVELKAPGSDSYVQVANIKLLEKIDKNARSYNHTIREVTANGLYTYRIANYPIGKKTPIYSEAKVTIVGEIEATPEKPVELTALLSNPNFDSNLSTEAWKGNGVVGGSADNPCMEKYNTDFDVYQEVSGLPEGNYLLTCQGFYRYGKSNTSKTKNAQFYANETSTPLMSITEESGTKPNSMSTASAAFSKGKYANNKLEFTITNGKLRFGVRKTAVVAEDWAIFDNFQLFYLGNGKHTDAINTIQAGQTGRRIYNMQGMPVNSPILSRGIYIVNGKKIIVK